ncbi:MAG: rhomboid family intramembrane serine protease [Bacteroidaceae bacterium]|nr:rhomboid family intramembrane serine protease [Bacteroidaceae bacterium]
MNTIPTITKNLLIINVLCFFASLAFGSHGIDLDELFGLHFFLASHFRPWQLFTYMFMHASWQHLFFNMFAVWMFGRIMEQTMGQSRFLFYYLTCGLGAGLAQELVQLIQYWYFDFASYEQVALNDGVMAMSDYLNRWNTVGASGAVYGILLSFGMTYPNERLFIFPLPVPIKAKYFVIGYAVIELLSALSLKGDGVAHMAHLGGMLVGFLLLLYWRGGNGGNRNGHGGYRNYGRSSSGSDSWNNFRRWFTSLFKKKEPHIDVTYGGRYGQEAAYRQQKKQDEEELNRILDKVKKNGYDGLTPEEKKRLFDISRK